MTTLTDLEVGAAADLASTEVVRVRDREMGTARAHRDREGSMMSGTVIRVLLDLSSPGLGTCLTTTRGTIW